MRARNMRGSTALAYEADVVMIMSNKSKKFDDLVIKPTNAQPGVVLA